MRIATMILLASWIVGAAPADAEMWTTTCRDSFLARAGTVTMGSFETLPAGGSTSYTEIPAIDLSGHFRVSTTRFMQIWRDPTHATDGDQILFWHTYSAPPYQGAATITFDNFDDSSAQIRAFGLHVIDWGTSGTTGQLVLQTSSGNTCVIDVVPPNLPGWNTFFFGVVSDVPFTRVDLLSTTAADWVMHDEVYYGPCTTCSGDTRFFFEGTLSSDCPISSELRARVGKTIAGSWVFDKAAVGRHFNPTTYPLLSFQLTTSAGVAAGAGPGLESTIAVANNLGTPARDQYSVDIAATHMCSPDVNVGQASLQLLDDDAAVFSDTSLPVSLPLSRFEFARLGMFISLDGILYHEACWDLTLITTQTAKADFDRDRDVDSYDLDTFRSCASGPAIPHPVDCAKADFDGDHDVDHDDFAVFQRCWSGEGRAADPRCG